MLYLIRLQGTRQEGKLTITNPNRHFLISVLAIKEFHSMETILPDRNVTVHAYIHRSRWVTFHQSPKLA